MKISKLKKSDTAFWIILMFVLIGVIFWALSNVPLKVKVSKTIEGICWNPEDESEYYTTELTLEGYYYDYIFENKKNDRYEGGFNVSDVGIMEDLTKVWLHYGEMPAPFEDISRGDAQYYNSSKNVMEKGGELFAPKNARLSKMILCGWVDSEYMYAFPAANIDEAKTLYDEIIDWEWGTD